MSDNVIPFPPNRIVRHLPQELDEDMATKMAEQRQRGRMNYAANMISEILDGLFAELESCGIPVNMDASNPNKDAIFLADVIKAVVYRTLEIDHPLHQFIDDRVRVRCAPPGATPEELAAIVKEMMEEFGNVTEMELPDDGKEPA